MIVKEAFEIGKITPNQAMQELTIMLMYLSRFNERSDVSINKAWKGYEFDIMNELDDKGYIRQGSYRSKSLVITEEGMKLAQNLLEEYNVKDWE